MSLLAATRLRPTPETQNEHEGVRGESERRGVKSNKGKAEAVKKGSKRSEPPALVESKNTDMLGCCWKRSTMPARRSC